MNPQYIFQSFIASGAFRFLFFWRSCLFYFPLMGCFIFSGGTYLAGQTSSPPVAKRGTDSDVTRFKEHDTDQNQRLSQQEFLKSVEKKERPRLLRDFKVFDGNHDQQLTFQEYQNLVAPDRRSLPHPMQERVVQRWQKLQTNWGSYDTDGDGKVAPEEFKVSQLAQSVPGLAATVWKDWDRNANGFVDQQEAEQVLEIAYGLRYSTGEVLWEPSGRMLTTMLFDHLDLNGDYQINLEEAKQAQFGFRDGKQTPALFKEWDQDGNGTLNITEWKAEPSHWRDPVGIFLNSDTDLDGLLNQKELVAGAESWTKEVSAHLIPAFDLDGDQHLSLEEYRQTPFSNLAREWQSLRSDRNQDGTLSLSEFSWGNGLLGAALRLEYFQLFDLDHNEILNWKEFPFRTSKRDPAYYAAEFKKLDTNQNQQLTPAEFLGKRKDIERQQAKRSFYNWDSNSDDQLSLSEFTERQKPKQVNPRNEFRFHDDNGDQQLTQKEFLTTVSPEQRPRMIRYFRVFDGDRNQQFTFQEYLNLVSPKQRILSHPIVEHVAALMKKLRTEWGSYDTDGDDKVSPEEFKASKLTQSVPGLTATIWKDWDRNANGFIDQQEAGQVLEIAYGLRYTMGEVLWEPSGRMLTTMLFDHLDLNGDHQIDLEEAKQAQFGFRDGKQTPTLFKKWDQDGNGKLNITEWKAEPTHWRDPVGIFLNSDTDLDGLLTREELLAGAQSWTKEVSVYLIPAFDLDGDKHLSLDEYRQTPFSNLAREWQSLRSDRNQDGTLDLSEFKWKEGLLAKSLAVEFFERLDLNHDGKLDLKEFPFRTNKRDPEYYAAEFKKLDTNQNQRLSVAEYLGSKEGAGRRQAKRSFYNWDHNADQQLDLTEFTQRQKPKSVIPENEFRFLDDNGDQILTQDEFLASSPPSKTTEYKRNFKLFDEDHNERLTFQEFQNIVFPEKRKLTHPIMDRVAKFQQKLQADWSEWDTNGDNKLNKVEFSKSNLSHSIPGLATTAWEDWDRDADGLVTQQNAEQVFEIAYGLRYPTGEVMWEPSGRMLTAMLYSYVDKNGDDLIDLAEAKQAKYGFHDNKQTPALFKKWDQDGNGKLSLAEWKTDASHWIDPVIIFLASDTDLDGLLTQKEHIAGAESWTKQVSEYLLNGFDLDGDQRLSLNEYRQAPFANQALAWQNLQTDRDRDGYLSDSEFYRRKGLFAAALAAEYFERLDINHDGKLDLKEFPFHTTKRDPKYYANEFKKLDADQNQQLTPIEFWGTLEDAKRKQAKRSFYDWDSNADNLLSLAEFTKRHKPKRIIPRNEFRFLDENGNQQLTRKEFLTAVSPKERPRLISDFKVFDEDQDQLLTFQEYQNLVAPDLRRLPHPMQKRVAQRWQKLQTEWGSYDTNGDGKVSPEEFKASQLTQSVPGLAATTWKVWDRDANGFVDQQEAEQVLEIAYGLRYSTGEVLWEPSGRMLTTMLFDHLDLNGDQQINLEEAKQAQFGFRDGKQTPALFKEWDQDGNGKLSISEWKADPTHWRDPVGIFLNSDTDLDGLLTREELLAKAELWTKEVSAYLIPAFDQDGDQYLSLDEYRQTPFSNLAREWQSLRSDRNQDGTLSLSEFKWKEGLLAKSLAVEFFERLDLNHDGKLELKEFPFRTNKRDPEYYAAEFKKLDTDQNQRLSVTEYLGSKEGAGRRQAKRSFYNWDSNADNLLSLAEFTQRQKPKSNIPQNEFRFLDENSNQLLSREEFLSAVSPKNQPQSTRYFKVFDQDGDHQLSYQEYLNLVSPKQRNLSHPVVEQVAALIKKLQTDWSNYDSNGDGKVSPEEFKTSQLTQSVPGLAATAWKDWDRDSNGFVDQQEIRQVLEIAYGLRYTMGEVLWEPSGRMLTTMLFDHLDLNGDHQIDLKEAKQAQFGFRDGKQTPALFKEWDQDGNGKLNITEWKAEPSHWRDPVGIFLNSDTDLDGLLSREELVAGAESWTKEVSAHLFPSFDLDGDQHLSLDEYRQTPFSNLAREWHSLRSDRNQDGTLSLSEFKWKEGLLAKSLAVEFFERLDLNHDGKLELKEFPFRTDKRDPEYYAAEFKKLDTDQNQRLSVTEYLGSKEEAGRRQAKRSFYNWDSNADDLLSLAEFTQRQKPKSVIPQNEFRFLDENDDHSLTQKEYLSSIPAQKRAGQVRYFKLFDADQNNQLTFLEYQNMIAPDKRNLPHPNARRVSEQLDHLQADWSQWDTSGDDKLDRSEFSASGFIRSIPGLALTVWEDWDRNADGVVDQQEIKQVLEIAYGLRYTTGEVLWEPSGRMLTAMLFDHLDLNGDHQIDLEEAKQAKFGFHDNKQTPVLFKQWDQDGNGKLSITEWKADPTHWRDPVGIFLNSDTDLDGLLTREELVSGAESWTKEVSAYLIPAFDLDDDLHLSLDEYRQTPFSNLAREWQSLRSDRDQDGKLNRSEFSWKDGLMAAALIVEYFQRFDLNQDMKLDESEFVFRAAPTRANLGTMFTKRDQNQDKTLSFEEYYGNLKLPDNASEKQIVHYESRLARFEDAFRKADINHDQKLDEPEFRSESSLEVIAPHLVPKKKNLSSLTVGKSETSDAAGGDSEVWIVLTLNVFLLLGALIFVLRKTKKSSV